MMLGNSKKLGAGWLGKVKLWAVATVLAGSILAVFLVACSSENREPLPTVIPTVETAVPLALTEVPTAVPTSPPAAIPTAIPRAVLVPPTATPAPRIFSGPVPASNIPFPTYATSTPRPLATRETIPPTLTPTPTATPGPAVKIMEITRSRMASSGGVAFEVIATLDFESGGAVDQVSITYGGDFRPGYNVADLSATGPSGTARSREITSNLGFGRVTQILDVPTGNWEPHRSSTPYFVDLPKLFGLEQRTLRNLVLQKDTTVDGIEIQVLKGELRKLDVAGGEGDLAAVFRIDRADGFLKEVEVSGILEFEENSALLGDTSGKTAAARLVVRLFDYGKIVPIVTPELALPLLIHQAVILGDGRVLAGSGFTGVANNDFIAPFPSITTHIYDPTERAWAIVEPVGVPGLMYSMLKLDDGRVLAVGMGSGEGVPGSNTTVFDPDTNSWSPLASKPTERALPSLALLNDGRVLATGGLNFGGASSFPSPEPGAEVEVLDQATGEWEIVSPLSPGFAISEEGPPLISLKDGRVLAMGSMTEESGSPPHAELYDSESNLWTPIGGLDPDFIPTDAVGLSDGKVLVMGTSRRFLVQPKLFNPVSNTWALAAEMNHPRLKATFTLLPDGRVLALGGTGRSSLRIFEESEEKFLPATNTWSFGPELQVPRTEHTATALLDGRVLIAGGIGRDEETEERYPLVSVEIIDLSQAP